MRASATTVVSAPIESVWEIVSDPSARSASCPG